MGFKICNLKKTIKGEKILDDLSFEIDEGKIYALIGQNGSGKTTTIKCILNFSKSNSGTITFNGKKIKTLINERFKIGYSPEVLLFPKSITLYAYLYDIGILKGVSLKCLKDRILELTELFYLSEYLNKNILNFSKGMKRKIAFIQSLLDEPKFLILDEPTDGLDPVSRRKVLDYIKDLSSNGTSILITSHILSDLEKVCDNVGVLYDGTIIDEINVHNYSVYKDVSDVKLTLKSNDQRQQINLERDGFVLFDGKHKKNIEKIEVKSFDLEDWYFNLLNRKGMKKC